MASLREKMGKDKTETRRISREEFLRALEEDLDPAKYAGEGWYATEEYAVPDRSMPRSLRAQIGREEEYYPETFAANKRKRRT